MPFVEIFRNLLIAAALALVSALLYRPPQQSDVEPQENDFSPSAREGTEIKHLFGTGPVQMMVVNVMDRETEEIKR